MKKFFTRLLALLLLFSAGTGQTMWAQNVTISPTSGKFIAGLANGNTSESGKVAGFYSTWVHEQLSLTVNTSDIANLTSAGDVADPACTMRSYNGKLILANGNTQTFMVVSLPKGYRITGYTITLQPDLNGKDIINYDDGGKSTSQAANFNPLGTEATSFYETKAWSSDFPYYQDSQQAGDLELAEGQYLAVAEAADGDKIMNPDTDANKVFTITRTAMPTADGGWDMGNQLYFWVGYGTSYYGFSINSFEIYFTAEGDFEAEVVPAGIGASTNYVTAPFTTSKTDLGAVTYNSTLGRYIYTYENVRDIKANIHLYQENAVSDGEPHAASSGDIHPVEIDDNGYFAFGNNTFYVEPPTTYSTASGISNQPIGFRVVGATFKPLWGEAVTGGTQSVSASCYIYRSTSGYLTSSLLLEGSTTTRATWQFDEYGNMYIGSNDNKQYLACYGEGNTRQLSLSSNATGEMARWNLRRDSNGRIYYKSDSNKYYYLYTKEAREGSKDRWRGYLITDGNAYPDAAPAYYSTSYGGVAYGYTAVTSTTNGSQTITLPSYNPGAYTLTVYDETGETPIYEKTITQASDTTEAKFTYDGYNNDAVKFMISGLEGSSLALVDVTLKLEALNPYIDRMTVVCTDENAVIGEGQTGKLRMTQTFTASDFGVNGGAFHFNIPSECAEDDLYITFEDLYSGYGDNTYSNGGGNARYSFVTSPYFQAFDGVAGNQTYGQISDAGYTMTDATDAGLYDDRYSADIASTTKIYTAVAGDKAFRFNNADVLTSGGTLSEYAFSVEKYLAPTTTKFSDNTTGTGAEFKQIVMNASNEEQNSGTYYLFTADETRYNIAPTSAWEHRSYAFYRMDITLGTVTYEPQVEFKPVYTNTLNGDEKDEAYYGAVVTAPYEDGGVTMQGYASTDKIFEKIEEAIADESVTVKPADAKHLLYLDFSQLAGIFQVTTGDQQSMSDFSATNAPNCLIFLPVGATAPNDNVAYKTQGGTFRMAHNLVLTDKEPFFSPYNISTGDNMAYYKRLVTLDKYGSVQNASLIMPFQVTVDNAGKHSNEDGTSFTLHTMGSGDWTVEDETATAYFPTLEVARTTEANKPYMVKLEDNEVPADAAENKYSFIVSQKGATITATPTNTDKTGVVSFTGHEASVSVPSGEAAGTYTFTSTGTLAGLHVNKDDNIFYFARNLFYSSKDLNRSQVSIYPFRAYYTTDAPVSVSTFNVVFGEKEDDVEDAIRDLQAKKMDMSVRSGKGTLTITSTADNLVRINSVSGVSHYNMNIAAGESRTVSVPAGIYVVNGVKILVK